jgi:hypothetical protein
MKFPQSPFRAVEIEKPPRPRLKRGRMVLLGCAVLWLLIAGGGLSVLWSYENAPGVAAAPPTVWPAGSQIQRAEGSDTLVMLVHPHCPCTRASLGELAEIMARCQGRLHAYVLFLKPEGFSDDWEKTDLWQTAASIPGVTAIVDDRGAEASRFIAATSGQTILYDEQGHLLFSGGITASRGHFGDNAGRGAIISLVKTGSAEGTETSVFGCPLFDVNSECRKSKDERNRF